MTDTTKEIKNLQLKIWLDKSPEERLHQFMTDNEALIKFLNEIKPSFNASKVLSTKNKIDISK